MKFYVVVNYYLVSLSFKFHKNPCTNACTQVVNERTRDKTCVRSFTAGVRAFIYHPCFRNNKLMQYYYNLLYHS